MGCKCTGKVGYWGLTDRGVMVVRALWMVVIVQATLLVILAAIQIETQDEISEVRDTQTVIMEYVLTAEGGGYYE